MNTKNAKPSSSKWRRFGEFLLKNLDLIASIVLTSLVMIFSIFGKQNTIILTPLTLGSILVVSASVRYERSRLGKIEEEVGRLNTLHNGLDECLVKLTKVEVKLSETDRLHNSFMARLSRASAKEFFKYPDSNAYESLKPLIEGAKEILLLGITNFTTIDQYFPQFEAALKNGAKMRILMLDPVETNPAVSMQATRSHSRHQVPQVVTQGLGTYEIILKLQERSLNLQVQGIYYLPGFGLLAINTQTPSVAKMCVKLYPLSTHKTLYPVFTLDTTTDKEWYDMYENQFEELWKVSHLLNHLPVNKK